MSVLLTSDWHLSDNPRDDYRHTGIATIRKLVVKHKAEYLLILGDLCEEKDRHGAWLVNRVVEHIDRLAERCRIIIMKGNHDYLVADSPFYQFLHRIPGVTWINNPTAFDLPYLGRCMFLPHTLDWKKDWEGLPLKENDWVFAHNTFDGADVGHGRTLRGIPTTMFPDRKHAVISGDIHVPQRLGPVTYVGAPYLVDFGDDYEPRALLIDNNQKVTSIPIEGPQKRLVEIGSHEFELYDKWNANEGDIVKIRVHLEPGEYAKWSEIKKAARFYADEMGLHAHTIQPVVERVEKTKTTKRSARAKLSDEDVLLQYVKSRGVDEKTANIGLKLVQEA